MIDSKWTNDEPASNSNGNGNGNQNEEAEENEENNEEEEGEEDNAESESDITEFWLIPEDPQDTENIYFFMSKYPAAEEMEDEESDDDEFFNGDNIEQMDLNEDNNRYD